MSYAIIGGCGSSGTTLLAHLLSKHHSIVSGPEMKFFNHPEALSLNALKAQQESLFARRRLPPGYYVVPTFLRAGNEFGIDPALFARWVADAQNAGDVHDAFARHMCEQTGTTTFVEKTPSNVYSFRALAAEFPDVPLIHQIRDGRDVVASFRNRGKSLFHAASLWLYETLTGMQIRNQRSYLETRYEDLVLAPEKALAGILSHIGLEFDPRMLATEPTESEGTYQEQWLDRKTPRAWNQLPSQPVSPQSIGRFRERFSADELSTIYRVSLTDRTRAELDSPVSTFGDLLDLLGYATADDAPAQDAGLPRVAERAGELADFARRAARTVQYGSGLPRRYTTIAARG